MIGWIVLGVVLLVAGPLTAPLLPEHAGGAIFGAVCAGGTVLLAMAGIGQFGAGRPLPGLALVAIGAVLAVLFVMVGWPHLQALMAEKP